MRLDKQLIRRSFALFTDLPDDGLESYGTLIDSAEQHVISMLKLNAEVRRNMERLCNAAAALAYYDYMAVTSGRSGQPNEIRVGDISLKGGDGMGDAALLRDEFMAKIADLTVIPTGFAFKSAEVAF